MTVRWTLTRLADDTTEDALFDVKVVDAVNRFGRHAIAYIDDEGGQKWDEYARGTAHELHVQPGEDYSDSYGEDYGGESIRKFTGFVVDRRERDNAGADELEVELYSFDHFLRRNNVTREYTDETISDILEDIIHDFTPVEWVTDNAEIVNDATISRDFRGEKVDNAIAELASRSGSEEFGVNDELEFFFRPRERESSPRDIDNSQWQAHDLPEKGKDADNELQLFYGEGGNEGSVIVSDGSDKLDLQQKIGTDGPVTLREEVTREDISDEQTAREKAEEILNERETTLTGTVTSFGLFDADPGQLINITIDARDLDDEFRIAELEYRWGRDETVVTIVEKRGAQDETLVRITDTLKRVEQRAADRDVPASIYEELRSGGLLRVTVTAIVREFGTARFSPGFGRDALGFGRSEPGHHIDAVKLVNETMSRATNALLNAVRDGWSGENSPKLVQVSVGDGETQPSRTDEILDSRQFDITASAGTPGETRAQIDASMRAPDAFTLREVGVEESDETLHIRATTEALEVAENAPLDVRVTVEALDNPDADGVITTDGSGLTRDIIADADPDPPTQIAFGRDNSHPSVSDTVLVDEISSEPIGEFSDRRVGEVDVESSWTNDTGGSETLREWGLKAADDTLLTRIVYADIIAEDSNELNSIQRLRTLNE